MDDLQILVIRHVGREPLRDWLAGDQRELTERLRRQLEADHAVARGGEDERYRQRQGEVSALIEQSTLARLTHE